MSEPFQYVTLATSLPHLGKIFSRSEVPISRYRLEQRLKMLEDEHRRLLQDIVEITAWAGVAKFDRDEDILSLAKTVVDELADFPDLQHLVGARMEMRTVVAALRRRQNGEETAGDVASWGYGRWLGRIRENWSDSAFGLGHFMPWVGEAQRLMQSGEHVDMERLVLSNSNRMLDHYRAQHQFDFEAIVIYVLQWTVVERWSRYSKEAAKTRLQDLLDAAMAGSDGATPSSANDRAETREEIRS